MKDKHAVHYTSARTGTGRDDWGTPKDLFDRFDAVYNFTLDCAASAENTLCERWLGPGSPLGEDALKVSWEMLAGPGSCWLNPPYSMLRQFLEKAHDESLQGVTVVCLVPARTDTKAWHEHAMLATSITLLRGRLRFTGGEHCAPFPSAVLVFEPWGLHAGEGPALLAMDAPRPPGRTEQPP